MPARSRTTTIEEERRLAYVGMTRAMERLTLTHATARSLYGAVTTTFRRGSSTSCRPRSSASGCDPRPGRATRRRRGRSTPPRGREIPSLSDRRLGSPRLARRGGRHADRARRRRHGAVRRRRQRAAADARVRAAREDQRAEDGDPRPHRPRSRGVPRRARRHQPLLRLGRDPERSERFGAPAAARAHARGLRRRRDHRGRGRIPFELTRPRRPDAVRRRDGRRRPADPSAPRPAAPVDARPARATCATVASPSPRCGRPRRRSTGASATDSPRSCADDLGIRARTQDSGPSSRTRGIGAARRAMTKLCASFPDLRASGSRAPGFLSRSRGWWEARCSATAPRRRRGGRSAHPCPARARRPRRGVCAVPDRTAGRDLRGMEEDR